MIKAQLSKPRESKVKAVNNFRVLARLPSGELGRALYPSAQARRRASITQGPTGPTRRRGGWKPPTKTPGARAQVTPPGSPAAALPAEVAVRARVPPPAPVGPGPASPAAGTGGGRVATPRRHHRRPAAETPSRTTLRRTAARRATAPGAGTLLPAAGSAAPRRRRSPGNRGSRTKAASRGPGDSYQRAPRVPTPRRRRRPRSRPRPRLIGPR